MGRRRGAGRCATRFTGVTSWRCTSTRRRCTRGVGRSITMAGNCPAPACATTCSEGRASWAYTSLKLRGTDAMQPRQTSAKDARRCACTAARDLGRGFSEHVPFANITSPKRGFGASTCEHRLRGQMTDMRCLSCQRIRQGTRSRTVLSCRFAVFSGPQGRRVL
jgi:hypothetical protein